MEADYLIVWIIYVACKTANTGASNISMILVEEMQRCYKEPIGIN